MKKLITILFVLLSISGYSQPAIDGVFDGTGVWGPAVGTANGTAGFNNVNVDKVYLTYDATYTYFAASFHSGGVPGGWQYVAFAINVGVGGGGTCPWGAPAQAFGHTNLPDFVLVGRLEGSWAELRNWTGSAWGGGGTNVYPTDMTWAGNYSYVEGRVLLSTLGNPEELDVQFYVGGNNNAEHGNFDSCPDDDVMTSWNDPTVLSNYVTEIALPVELISFTASVIGKDVKINWQTATEVDNYGFEILRSAQNDKVNWTKIGFVNGHGNSNSTKNYSFTDRDVLNGSYSYRLKQIDADGNFAYSPIVEVIINNLPSQFELSQNYPNPFNPSTLIKYSLPSKEFVQLRVFNVLGSEIATLVNEVQEAGNYTIEFNASKININTSGIYFYRLEAGTYVDSRKMTLVK